MGMGREAKPILVRWVPWGWVFVFFFLKAKDITLSLRNESWIKALPGLWVGGGTGEQ